MLSKLVLKAGSNASQPSLNLPLSPVTIFVGPNNSGKSRALVEIENWATRANQSDGLIVSRIEFEPWTAESIEHELFKIQVEPTLSEAVEASFVLISKRSLQGNSAVRTKVYKAGLLQEAQNPNGTARNFYSTFLSLFTLRLDGKNRLALTDPQPVGDLQKTPPNHLAHLFVDNDARANLRQIIFEAFGKYLVIDPTDVGKLRLRLSNRPPIDEREEKGFLAKSSG